MADVYLMYGFTERNSEQDAYMDRFPNRHLPRKHFKDYMNAYEIQVHLKSEWWTC